jgi:hypothetical protein
LAISTALENNIPANRESIEKRFMRYFATISDNGSEGEIWSPFYKSVSGEKVFG